jgi:two-component system NtrC family sensor kinase
MDGRIGGAAFAAIVRASLEAIIVADEHGRVLEFNPAAERMFGWSRAEAMGQTIGTLLVPPDLRDRHEQGMARMRAGAAPRLTEREVQMEAMHRGGRLFPCALSVARLDVPGPALFAASIRDLSDLETERRNRHAVEDMLRAIFDDQTEVIFRYDADRRIIFYNRAACRLYGVTPTAMLGHHLLDDVDPGLRPRLRAELDALTVEAPVVQATDFKVMPDGETRWFDWTNRALFDAQGRLTGYQAVGRDVTGQHLARMALAASEARFAAFMRHAPVGMYIKDADGRYTVVNPEMEKVFGRPVGEVVGRHPRDLVPEGLLPVIEAADAEVRSTGRPSTVVEWMEGADTYEWTLVVRFPIEAPEGGPPQIGGFDIDISAMKRAQAELERAREVLHQNEKLRALGHFAAGVAHELNNPLAIIAGQAELLAEDVADGPLAGRAGMIRRAADRCSRVVHSALAMVRQRPPDRRPADLNGIVLGAVALARQAPGGGVPQIDAVLADPPPQVSCDPDQIHQVILNLLTNARESLGGDGAESRITVTTETLVDGSGVAVEVRDSGPGVPDPLWDRVFDAYFTTKAVGTGIGLAFCRSVVEAHGGRIDLVPSPRGARFRIVLPDLAAEAPEGPAPAPVRGAASGDVLIVDDEPDFALSVAEMLRREGYATTVAPGGDAAIGLLRQRTFDLVLLDLDMSEPGGLGVHAWMVAAHPSMVARTVFVTGALLDPAMVEAVRRTGRPVMEKPLRAADVRLLGSFAR